MMATPDEGFMATIQAANAEAGTDETPSAEVATPAVADAPAAPTTPVAAAPTPVAVPPVSAVPQGPRVASFDDLTPDDPRLPPTRRKAAISLLIDDRTEAIQKRDEMGNLKNAAEARALVAEKALEILTRRMEPPPAPAAEPAPPETSIDALRRRIDPASLQFDPDGVLAAAVETADERSQGYVSESEKKIRADLEAKNALLDQRIATIETERATLRTVNAYKAAFPDRNPATDPDLDDISFLIEATNNAATAKGLPPPLPVDDPQSYRIAAARLDAIAARRTPPAPAPTPVPTLTVAAAAPAPAPPAGSGAPAGAAPPASIDALPQHERTELNRLFDIFPQLKGKGDLADEIIGSVAADAAIGKNAYSRKNVKRSATA